MIILMYHGVVPDKMKDRFLTLGHIHASAFERQMAWLSRNAVVFSLADCVRLIRNGERLPWNATVITLDDGFRNNAVIAFPILNKYRFPATFFVATSHLQQDQLLWFNYLTALVHLETRVAGSTAEKLNLLHQLRNRYIYDEPARMVAADYDAGLLERIPKDTLESTLAGMTRDQLYQLAQSELVEIGGHTITHPRLTRCSPEETKREISLNKLELESITGRKVRFFAYPEGDQNPAVVEIVRQSGYEAAVVVEPVPRARHDLFRLPRVGIHRNSHWLFVAKWFRVEKIINRARRAIRRRKSKITDSVSDISRS